MTQRYTVRRRIVELGVSSLASRPFRTESSHVLSTRYLWHVTFSIFALRSFLTEPSRVISALLDTLVFYMSEVACLIGALTHEELTHRHLGHVHLVQKLTALIHLAQSSSSPMLAHNSLLRRVAVLELAVFFRLAETSRITLAWCLKVGLHFPATG